VTTEKTPASPYNSCVVFSPVVSGRVKKQVKKMIARSRNSILIFALALLPAAASAQTLQSSTIQGIGDASPITGDVGKAPKVTMTPLPITTVPRAKATMVKLDFRIPGGYHINSNTPKSEFLIPTALKMDVPTDIILGKIEYPAGEDRSFPFSPDEKLSVYSGPFTIAVAVHPLASVVPGKYLMRGVLRYQACDNSACYPPKNLPVSFEVKVVKEPAARHSNPAQSPHVHN
jgi:hypothetical protein